MTDPVYCASKAAIEAAAQAYFDLHTTLSEAEALSDALIAAHHPSLGLDRSVCLRDVVDALEARYSPQSDKAAAALSEHPADLIERTFGANS